MPTNLGTGGSALDAQAGSTSGADTNDPKFLGRNAGDPAYVYLPGVSGNVMTVPAAGTTWPTATLDIRCKVALDDWTPAATTSLTSRRTSATVDYHHHFYVDTSGKLNLAVSTSGTGVLDTPTASSVATGITDGTTKWVRAVFVPDNGASGREYRYYTSDDGVTWADLGTPIVVAGTASSLATTTANFAIGSGQVSGTTNNLAGKVFRAVVTDGTTTVLDVDTSVITSGAATSFTATTGQTVSIARSTSGRKSVAVVTPVWSLGSDDFFEVADNDALDFAAGDSFTVLAVWRQWATSAVMCIVSKRETATSLGYPGWNLTANLTDVQALIGDASVRSFANKALTAGPVIVGSASRNVAADTVTANNGTSGTPTADTTTGTLANALPMRVGRLAAGSNYAEIELVAAAVWRRVLTADEIAAVTSYYASRWP